MADSRYPWALAMAADFSPSASLPWHATCIPPPFANRCLGHYLHSLAYVFYLINGPTRVDNLEVQGTIDTHGDVIRGHYLLAGEVDDVSR